MEIVDIVKLIFGAAILALPLAAGMQASPKATVHLLQRWDLGLKAVLALFVIVPTVVVIGCLLANLPRPVNAALLVLSVAPMLPTLHFLLHRVGADHRYVIGLEVMAALVSLVAVPALFWIVSRLVPVVIRLDVEHLIMDLFKNLLAPLVAGMLVFVVTKGRSEPWGRTLTTIATILVLSCGLLMFWSQRDVLLEQFQWRTLVGIVAFVAAGAVTGHLLGGPEPGNRAALALVASGRNAGLAIAILNTLVPEHFVAASSVIFMYILVRPLLMMPYARRAMAQKAAA